MSGAKPTAASKARQHTAGSEGRKDVVSKTTGQKPALHKDKSNSDEGTPIKGTGSRAQSPFTRPQVRSAKSGSTAKSNTEISAETEAITMEMNDLRVRLREAETAQEASEKELFVVKQSSDSLQKEYVRLEENLLGKASELESKDAMIDDLAQRLKVSEQKAEEDRAKLLSEQTQFSEKHNEMTDKIQRLHQRTNSMASPPRVRDLNGLEDGESSLHSRTNSGTNVLALQMSISSKDRQIQALEHERKNLQDEVDNLTQSGLPGLAQLEQRIDDLVLENSRLREDIDGYQTLLQDKTVNGEFAMSPFMQSTSSNSNKYQSMRGRPNGIDLASELDSASLHSNDKTVQNIEVAGRADLEAEVLKLQESNKALTLYVNTIVARMLNTQGFEHLLAKDPADMQPLNPGSIPTSTDKAQAPSFLQRTKSVLSRKTPAPNSDSLVPDSSRLLPVAELPFDRRTSLDTNSYGGFQRSVDEASRRSKSPAMSSSRSPVNTPKGLRPLASGVAADRISPGEARRLSAQFAPAMLPPPSDVKETFGPPLVSEKKAKRSSWMGWLGKEKDSPAAPGSTEDIKSLQRLENLKPLEEIDQEIEREVTK